VSFSCAAVERISRIISCIVAVVGAAVIVGWILEIELLKSVLPGLATMKVNTAGAFVALGTALWLLTADPPSSRLAAQGLLVAVIALGCLTLAEYLFAIDIGIDQMIVHDTGETADPLHPGRMSVATALNLCLIGTALLASPPRPSRSSVPWASWLLLPAGLVALVAILGYVYDVRGLYAFGPYNSIAIHTAVLFAVLCIGAVCANPRRGIVSIAISDTAGGMVSRRLLPTIPLALFVLGWVRLMGQDAGLYDTHTGLAIMVVASIAVSTFAIAWTASALHEADLRGKRAEAQLVALNAELEARVALRTAELARSLEVEVAERRRAEATERKLAMSDEQLDFALRSHQLGAWSLDLRNRTVQRSLTHAQIFGYSTLSPTWTFETFLEHVIPEDRPAVSQSIQAALAAKSDWTFDCRIRRADGEIRHILVAGTHGRDAAGVVVAIKGLVQDTTERRRVEEVQQRMTALVEFAADAIVTKSLDGVIRSWNPAAEQLLGYRAKEIVGQPVMKLLPADRQDEESMILDQLRKGERVSHFETVRRRKDGSLVDVSLTISPIRDPAGNVIGASKIMRDITDRKQYIEQLRKLNAELEARVLARTAELKEREVMIQEIHHRVKNNLQVISSLINMQIRPLADTSTRLALRQCQSRVETMAEIHEMLYQAKDYSRIPFAKYAKELAARILSASGMAPAAISLIFDCEDLSLPVDQAIPCGLILNELVANTLKHAFPNAASGEIRIELRRVDQHIVLAVIDNGIGIAPEFDPAHASSLGVRLVVTLVEQLDGSLEILRHAGTTFRITFPSESTT
jgi:PAS domain S-box-containing protein